MTRKRTMRAVAPGSEPALGIRRELVIDALISSVFNGEDFGAFRQRVRRDLVQAQSSRPEQTSADTLPPTQEHGTG